MCKIFYELEPAAYACQTRSVRLGGHVTSIRLEALFWRVLEEIAASEGASLGRFLTKLHDEVLEFHGGIGNFAGLLRCACMRHLVEVRANSAELPALMNTASTMFAGSRRETAKVAQMD
jgi:predicted DNA-binding ribbon-helix-helix protein